MLSGDWTNFTQSIAAFTRVRLVQSGLVVTKYKTSFGYILSQGERVTRRRGEELLVYALYQYHIDDNLVMKRGNLVST